MEIPEEMALCNGGPVAFGPMRELFVGPLWGGEGTWGVVVAGS